MKLASILSDFESILTELESPLLERFNPGLSDNDLKAVFSQIDLPGNVYDLYSWRNGMWTNDNELLGRGWMLPLASFMPAQKACEYYTLYAGKNFYPYDWHSHLFPLFESLGGGDYLLLDIDPSSSTFGVIYNYCLAMVDSKVLQTKFDSLETLFTSAAECYKKGVFIYDSAGYDDSNLSLAREIGLKHNPLSEFYKNNIGG